MKWQRNSPEGTASLNRSISAVPPGLAKIGNRNPALKRPAISDDPSGISERGRRDNRGRGISRRYAISPFLLLFFALFLAGFVGDAHAQTTYSTTTVADAFLTTGSTNNPDGEVSNLNFGAAGTMAVAPANAIKGEFQSVARFDFSAAKTVRPQGRLMERVQQSIYPTIQQSI